jgi:hypothetical protein
MAIETTYTVKIRSGEIWQFKYNLNGILTYFNVMEGDLTDKQEKFLYQNGKFPFKEVHLKDWEQLYPPTKVEITPPDLSFEAGWNQYSHKLARQDAEKSFKKMTDAERLKFFLSLPAYERYLMATGIAKCHMATYINKKYYENEYPEAVSTKNSNPMIQNLAKLKTDRRK